MGESEVLQVVETDRKLRMEEIFTHFINQAMEEKKEEAKQESKASRWEKARPRSLEYYNQVFHQTPKTFSQIQGVPKKAPDRITYSHVDFYPPALIALICTYNGLI